MDEATRRLLFWLKIPYVADVVLVIVGVGYLIAGNGVGWWVLVFAGGRAVVGTIALFWIAPKMIARMSERNSDDDGPTGKR